MREGSRPARIGLLGGFGTDNVGNDATLDVTLAAIDRLLPGAEVTLITPFPERAEQRWGLRAYPMSPSLDTMRGVDPKAAKLIGFAGFEIVESVRRYRLLRGLDVLLAPGTGLLDDFAAGPASIPYALLTWSTAARAARTPVHMVCIGAGPIRRPSSRAMMRAAALQASSITCRDTGSVEFLRSLDPRLRPRLGADLVLAAHDSALQPADRGSRGDDAATVGLGLMAYGGWDGELDTDEFDSYVDRMAAVVSGLVAAGHRVRILTGQPVDERAVTRVLELLEAPTRSQVTYRPAATFAQLLEQTSDTDLVVTSRYHGVVAAVLAHRPILSLGYAPKNDDLLTAVGLEGSDVPIAHFEPGDVLGRVARIVASGGGLGLPAESSVAVLRQRARRALEDAIAVARGARPHD